MREDLELAKGQITWARVFLFALVSIFASAALVALGFSVGVGLNSIGEQTIWGVLGLTLFSAIISIGFAWYAAAVTFPACFAASVICFLLFGRHWWERPTHLGRGQLIFRAVASMVLSAAFAELESLIVTGIGLGGIMDVVLFGAFLGVFISPFLALRIFQPAARG